MKLIELIGASTSTTAADRLHYGTYRMSNHTITLWRNGTTNGIPSAEWSQQYSSIRIHGARLSQHSQIHAKRLFDS